VSKLKRVPRYERKSAIAHDTKEMLAV